MVLPEIATTVSGISKRLSSLLRAVTIISSSPRLEVLPIEVTASSATKLLLAVKTNTKPNKDIVIYLV